MSLWAEAADLARVAMGRLDENDPARKLGLQWRADVDPLAWWTLTELLVAFATKSNRRRDGK